MRKATNPDLIFNIKIQSAFAIAHCQKCWHNLWGWRAWQATTDCQWKVFVCWVSKSCFTSESGSQVFFWEAYTVAVSKYALFIFSSWDTPSDINFIFFFFHHTPLQCCSSFQISLKSTVPCVKWPYEGILLCQFPDSSAPGSFESDFCGKNQLHNWLSAHPFKR